MILPVSNLLETPEGTEADDSAAAAHWNAFVAGRWSLADTFEHDGRRYFLAHRDAPSMAADWSRRLTPREQRVVVYATLGFSNKAIGYEMGLATSGVSAHLTRAMRKLGATSRVSLLRLLGSAPAHEGAAT
jgi:DNA-binding NarL/FixJ family response regulator